ncbi:MAG: hypothetical protein ACJA1F_001550 [Paracoccaceae bacterium]|jgi:uncharacterized protein
MIVSGGFVTTPASLKIARGLSMDCVRRKTPARPDFQIETATLHNAI